MSIIILDVRDKKKVNVIEEKIKEEEVVGNIGNNNNLLVVL